ncbi:MAG: PorV/PorQ family protein [Candidatus Aerophobetes bacterium]|nr:PorV/PorQ family protein [Candidatus Aerophobetes bacterium]
MFTRQKTGIIGGLLIFILISAGNVYAGVGTTAVNFLKIGLGARASAMGDAFTALADDGSCLYWNPAGLVQLKDKQLLVSYNSWFAGIKRGYISFTLPLSEEEGVGVGTNYLDMGTLEGRDEEGNPTEPFGASDFQLSVGYAKRFSDKFMAGLSGGILKDTIAGNEKNTYSVNAGILFFIKKSLSLGLSVQNIGPKLSGGSLPLNFKLGVAKKTESLTLTADISKPTDNRMYFSIGGDWSIRENLFLRVGYKSNRDIASGITIGIGLKRKKIGLDYAYLPYGDLGNTHRVSLIMRF